jgi:hypothetical protein
VIGDKLLKGVAAGAVVATAACVTVLALAFAAYAGLRTLMGEAASAAIVAAAFGALTLLIVCFAGRRRPRPAAQRSAAEPMIEALLDMVRAKPLVSTAIATVVGLILSRNPELLATLVRIFTTQPRPKDD